MAIPFQSEARRQFDPVGAQFGMTCVAASERMVRYENGKIALTVSFDSGRSYELEIYFGRIRAPDGYPDITLRDVLRLKGVDDPAAIHAQMFSKVDALNRALERFARLIAQHAGDLLAGNDLAYARVEKSRDEESEIYGRETKLRYALADAEPAWSSGNYAGVIKALAPVEQYLSPAEKKRLEYARKRMKS